jgi:small subunit ribosomal protein S15
MSISAEKRQQAITTARRHGTDSGSPEVQITLLTERINALSEHLQGHRKDNHSYRGLVQMVNKRNRLLKYLARAERDRYTDLIHRLGLRK